MIASYRKTAIAVGVFYIIGAAAGVLSTAFWGPVQDIPGYLQKVSENESQVIAGALCVLAMGRVIDPNSAIRNVFAPPIALQEMVMAVWLIIKGFHITLPVTRPVDAGRNQLRFEHR